MPCAECKATICCEETAGKLDILAAKARKIDRLIEIGKIDDPDVIARIVQFSESVFPTKVAPLEHAFDDLVEFIRANEGADDD